MVISDPALVVVTDTRDRFLRRLGSLCRLRRHGHAPYQYDPSPTACPIPVAANPIVGPVESTAMHTAEPGAAAVAPRKSADVAAREIVLSADERRARAIALRGLCQSRAHRFDAARASFVEATLLDPTLDLAKMPDFWRLPSGAHQAAIEAYEQVGRRRDAAALTATVRTTFRPKPFRTRQPVPRPVPEV
jgi:hypothetical protein